MSRKGRKFELAYKHLYDMLDKTIYDITSPAYPIDKTTGKVREVDVLIEYNDADGKRRRISIECRDRNHPQDIIWIEQLVQKREDLDLDLTIATTTSSFTDGAIAKAKYHGIIVEQAVMPSPATINALQHTTFVDFFFFKYELLEYSLIGTSIGIVSLKKYINTLNVIDKHSLINDINTKFLFSFEPNDILQKHPNSIDFFSNEDNHIIFEGTIDLDDTKPLFFKNISTIIYKIKIVPRKISLPIKNCLSVYTTDDHTNKKYRAEFKNDTDCFTIGYLNEQLLIEFGLKKRKYWRLASSSINLNTIIPENVVFDSNSCIEHIIKNHLGEFDLTKVLS